VIRLWKGGGWVTVSHRDKFCDVYSRSFEECVHDVRRNNQPQPRAVAVMGGRWTDRKGRKWGSTRLRTHDSSHVVLALAALTSSSPLLLAHGTSTPVDWCGILALNLDGECVNIGRSAIHNTGGNGDEEATLPAESELQGFKLTADPDHALHFMGNSFDDQHTTRGNITPRNVCALAIYGNRAASYTDQGTPTEESYGTLSQTLACPHWAGNCCTRTGCDACTNYAYLSPDQDWNDFSKGNHVICDIDDIDTDLCWSSVICVVDLSNLVPTVAPTSALTATVADDASPEDGGIGGGVEGEETDSTHDAVPSAPPTTSVIHFPEEDKYTVDLFAMISASQCAENLGYGPQQLVCEGVEDKFDFNPTLQHGFLSTHSAQRYHQGWWQMVTMDGWNPLFHIVYKFKEEMTLQERFETASREGVLVDYEIWDGGFTRKLKKYTNVRYFGADNEVVTAETFATTKNIWFDAESPRHQAGFSQNNWLWGAARGIVNGNDNECNGNQVDWGHGNYDSTDSFSCKRIYQNGVWEELNTAVSYMYMIKEKHRIDEKMFNKVMEDPHRVSLWECHAYATICYPIVYYLGVAATALTANWFTCVLLSSTIEPPGCSLYSSSHSLWLPGGRRLSGTCFAEVIFAPFLIAGFAMIAQWSTDCARKEHLYVALACLIWGATVGLITAIRYRRTNPCLTSAVHPANPEIEEWLRRVERGEDGRNDTSEGLDRGAGVHGDVRKRFARFVYDPKAAGSQSDEEKGAEMVVLGGQKGACASGRGADAGGEGEGDGGVQALSPRLAAAAARAAEQGQEGGHCCTICLAEYEAHDSMCELPCGHQFHSLCIDLWLDNNTLCPLCKHDLMSPTEVQRMANAAASPVVREAEGRDAERRTRMQLWQEQQNAVDPAEMLVPYTPSTTTEAPPGSESSSTLGDALTAHATTDSGELANEHAAAETPGRVVRPPPSSGGATGDVDTHAEVDGEAGHVS